jgi:two-component system NarL family sensor kinase
LRQEAERGVADIRRIAYNLRPPILDELGLAGAVREQAARLGCATVRVSPITLPVLPAAVEVAAYRIALEALTNASRHAPGAPVEIELSVNGRLQLDISDAGEGIGASARAGVGITSMSDRAAELGGECVVRDREPHGTVVSVWLPLQEVVT